MIGSNRTALAVVFERAAEEGFHAFDQGVSQSLLSPTVCSRGFSFLFHAFFILCLNVYCLAVVIPPHRLQLLGSHLPLLPRPVEVLLAEEGGVFG